MLLIKLISCWTKTMLYSIEVVTKFLCLLEHRVKNLNPFSKLIESTASVFIWNFVLFFELRGY